MQGEVTPEVRMDNGKMATRIRVSGMYGFHATVKTQNEIIKIQADSQPVGHGYLAPKAFQAELATGLFRIIADSPNVARVHKHSPVQFPKQESAILRVEVQLDVARLVNEVDTPVSARETSRPEFPHRPSAHTVRPAAEITLLIGKDRGIAIWVSHPDAKMQSQ